MNHCSLLLGVNIDHIATIRQARKTVYPDPVQAALTAEQAGADGITAHLREDRRHIQDRDIRLLKDMLNTRLNLEMAISDPMIKIASDIKPVACCLVPEKRQELTTEGGLDILSHLEQTKKACDHLKQAGIEVSLFIDPDTHQIDAALQCAAPVIELHTGEYANASGKQESLHELSRLQEAAQYAHSLGIQVNAGHGLTYHNVTQICRIPEMVELNIGHAIIGQALFSGLDLAVRDMKALLVNARS